MADQTAESGEKPLFLWREKHMRFRTLTSLLEITEGITEGYLAWEGKDLRNEEPITRRQEKQLTQWNYINCFASLLVRDNESVAIIPTSRPGREGLMIAFNSTRQKELAPETIATDTADDLGWLAVYEWFFKNGGDKMSLGRHIERTTTLIKKWHKHKGALRYNILWRHTLLASRVKMAKTFITGMDRREGEAWTGPNYFFFLAADAALIPDTLLENVRSKTFQKECFCQPPSAAQLALMDKYLSEYDESCWSTASIYGNAQSRKRFQTLLSAVVRQAWEELSTFIKLLKGLGRKYKKYVLTALEGFEKQCRQVDDQALIFKCSCQDLTTLQREFGDVLEEHLRWMQLAFDLGQPAFGLDKPGQFTPNDLVEEVQSIIEPIEGLDMTPSNTDKQASKKFEASQCWAKAAEQYLVRICFDYQALKSLKPNFFLSGRIAITDVTTVAIVPNVREDMGMAPVTEILEDTSLLCETRRESFKRWFLGQEQIADVHKRHFDVKCEDDSENREDIGKVQGKTGEKNDETTTKATKNASTPNNPDKKRRDSQEDIQVKIPDESGDSVAKRGITTTTTPHTIPTSIPFTASHDPTTILLSLSLFAQNHTNLPPNTPFTLTPSTYKTLKSTNLKYVGTHTPLSPTAKKFIALIKAKQKKEGDLPLLHPSFQEKWSAVSLSPFMLREVGEEIYEYARRVLRKRIERICAEQWHEGEAERRVVEEEVEPMMLRNPFGYV